MVDNDSGGSEGSEGIWSLESLAFHLAALREADFKWAEERDRRYLEVSIEREKALKIKEVADLAALQLAREIQTYKDEKANELREQIGSERGLYATKDDLTNALREVHALIAPLTEYISAQRGRGAGVERSWGMVFAVIGVISVIISIYLGLR